MYRHKDIYLDAVDLERDTKLIHAFYNDWELQQGIETTADWVGPRTLKDVEDMISGGAARWTVKLVNGGDVIGFVSIGSNWISRTFEPMMFIARDHRGKGYGKQLLDLILFVGFMEMNHRKATATVFSFNKSSIANIEAHGFLKEGALREECFRKGDYHDVLKYGIMLDEWQPSGYERPMKIPSKCDVCDCASCEISTEVDCKPCLDCNGTDKTVISCVKLASYKAPDNCDGCACEECGGKLDAKKCGHCIGCQHKDEDFGVRMLAKLNECKHC